MKRLLSPPALLLLASILLTLPDRPWAQEHLGEVTLSGQIELSTDLSRQRFDTSGSPERELDQNRFQEQLDLNADGYLLRPDLLHFRLSGDFGYRQDRLDATDADLDSDRGKILGYDVLFDLFSSSPVSVSLFGNRFEDRARRDFGSDTDVTGDSLGTTIRFQNSLFPMSLTRRRLRSKTETLGLDIVSRRDEERDILEFNGLHESEATRLRLQYRDEDVDDRSVPPVGDYRIRELSGGAKRNWGAYLEHTFGTSLRSFRRTGSFELDTSSAISTYRWAATEDLNTELRYQYDRFDSSGRVTTTQSSAFLVRHQLYESLQSRFRLFGNRSDLEEGERTQAGGGLALRYRKRLPWSSRLNATLHLRHEIKDDDLSSSEIPVVGEGLTIDSFTDNPLENRRVDPGSIVVTDAAGTPLIEGVDYDVVQIGDRVSIEVLPGGVITVPQDVIVDYVFETSPDIKFSTTRMGFGIGWDLDWLLFRYRHERSEDDLLDGEDGRFLEDSRADLYRIELRRRLGQVRGSVAASFFRERAETTSRDEWELTQKLFWDVTRRLLFSVDLREGVIDFKKPDRRTDVLAGNASLIWRARGGHSFRLFSHLRRIDDSSAEDQLYLEYGARAQLHFGRLDVIPSLRWSARERDSSRADDLRALLRLVWAL